MYAEEIFFFVRNNLRKDCEGKVKVVEADSSACNQTGLAC